MKLLAILALATLAAGCKPHARLAVMPLVTPAQGRTQQAAIMAAWKAGKITTDEANRRFDSLAESVTDYCANHYCGS